MNVEEGDDERFVADPWAMSIAANWYLEVPRDVKLFRAFEEEIASCIQHNMFQHLGYVRPSGELPLATIL